MRRVCVIGPPGSGKSTFARALARREGLPVVHLDVLFWKPGWIESDPDDFDERVLRAAAEPQWVIDGNYGRTLSERLARADTVVFLDLPRWRCLPRIVRRRWKYARRPRPDMTQGCNEKITWGFFVFAWRWPSGSRLRKLRALRNYDGRIVTLRSPAAARRFLAAPAR